MKILNTLITLGCLGGLVSCYPVNNSSLPAPAPLAAKKKTVSTPSTATAVKKKTAKTTAAKKKYIPKKKKTYTPKKKTTSTSNTPEKVVKKPTPPKKPAIPKVVKNASKVPGKDGFVFNPYTNNQVDVRGIPSGTKVRDPHDSNPAHIFRVP